MIKPLGEQIIIRTLPPERVGSIIIPDSAKRITHQGTDDGPGSGSEELQYVNRWLFEDVTETIKRLGTAVRHKVLISEEEHELLKDLIIRAEKAVLPKTEKGILPSAGAGLNFVEAEVIAVGTGVRARDSGLFWALVAKVDQLAMHDQGAVEGTQMLLDCAAKEHRVPFMVKPGDRILFHPSVQKFDRQIQPEWIGLKSGEGDCFIIREESVLAILDSEEECSATQTDSAVA